MCLKALYTILLLGVLIAACTDKPKEVLSMDDLLPKSERYGNEDDHQVVTDEADTLMQLRAGLGQAGIVWDSIRTISETEFPERFGTASKDKYTLFIADQQVSMYKWTYKDSTKTTNAFFNWMDCFGNDCVPHVIGGEERFQKDAFLLYTNDTAIFYVSGPGTVDMKPWKKYFEGEDFEADWNYVIEQSRGGKAKWFTFVDEKKQPIIKKSGI